MPKKELRELIREIQASGEYVVTRERGGHYKVRRASDAATLVTLPSTPGGKRWLANVRAELRRKGIL